MTARFTIDVRTPLTPDEAVARLLDLDRHTRLIPLTRVHWKAPLHEGSRFTARTALGPLILDDVMAVRALDPACARLEKIGSLLAGTTEITATPEAGGSRVTWVQEIGVRGWPLLDRPAALLGPVFYGFMVRRLLA